MCFSSFKQLINLFIQSQGDFSSLVILSPIGKVLWISLSFKMLKGAQILSSFWVASSLGNKQIFYLGYRT